MTRAALVLGFGAAVAIVLLAAAVFRVSRRAHDLHGKPMRLLDHLRELRYRLLASLGSVTLAAVALFSFALERRTPFGLDMWVPIPSVRTSIAAQALDLLLGFALPEHVTIVVLTPSEALLAQLQTALIGGLIVASPIVAYQVAAFVTPALHPRERRILATLAPLALAFLLAGVVFGLLVMVPLTLTTLYEYAAPLGAQALARPQDVVTFVLFTCLVFGAAFELPLVMAGLAYAGVLGPGTMGRHWRGVVVTILIVGSIVTPDPTPVSQLIVAMPLTLLYLLGLLFARVAWGMRRARQATAGAASFS